MNRMTFRFCRMLDTAGKKSFLSHSRKWGHSIHSEFNTIYSAPAGPPFVKVVYRYFPLYTM